MEALGFLRYIIKPLNKRTKPKVLNEAVSLKAQFALRPTWKQTTAAEARMEMLVEITKTTEALAYGSIFPPLAGST